jgi:sortase B
MYTNFKGEEERCGTPFADYRTKLTENEIDLTDVTVVYGHHMSGGLMFADITQYQDQSFYNKHPFFIMYTPDGQAYKIDVAACEVISGDDDTALHAWDFASQLDFNRYYRRVLRDSTIQTNTELEYGDKLMTLVTCVYGHGTNKRCLVIGKVTKVLVNRELLEASNTEYNIVK